MGKKKMVMRRIAALLIASLVVTSSAFMSLAETPSSSGGGSGTIQDKYYDLVQPNDVTLKVGETKTITLESKEATKPNAIYATKSDALLDGAKWQSSDSTTVTIAGTGKTVTLKGEKVGEATVSVQSTGTNADGQDFESSLVTFKVTVSAPETPTIKISMDEKLSVKVGETKEIKPVVEGAPDDYTVEWSSSDETVATVKNGVVTGKKAGTAIITATVAGKSASCTVTVTEDTPAQEDKYTIELNEGRLYLLVGESFKINAILNKNAEPVSDAKIDWIVENKDVLDLAGDTITGKAIGITNIVATATVDGKAVNLEKSSYEVQVILKAIIDKENFTLIEGSTTTITLEGPEGAVVWTPADGHFGILGNGEEGIVNVTKGEGGKTIKVEALKPGKVVYRVWGLVEDAQGEHWSKNEFAVEVIAAEPTVEEPKLDDNSQKVVDELVAGIEDEAQKEEIRQSVQTQTEDIHKAVKAAAENANIETSDTAKEVFAAIEEVPVNSEIKLLSVSSAVKVETGSDGKPILDDDGKPVVVIHELVYNIGIVTDEGEVLPHDALENNNRNISINVPLPATGIKDTWRYATIKHYADDACTQLLQTLYSNIFGSAGNKYITLVTKKFSPFVLTFSDTNPNPPTNNGGSSSSGGGGGSRRHVVGGGGSSTNSYSMTGNWVAGANGWSFVKSDGSNAANTWGYINGQYYYFDAAGNMATGWQLVNGKWYYLNATTVGVEGAMLTGVIYDPAYNAYFYADASGAMVTGWYQVGANWYYFSPVNDGVHVTGQLLAGTYVDGYYLGADGAWVPGN